MVNELFLAITNGLGLGAIGKSIHPYPTQAEVVKRLADAYNRTRLTPFIKRILGLWLPLAAPVTQGGGPKMCDIKSLTRRIL
jgi:hypothetical protein